MKEEAILEAAGVCVRFTRVGDRISHAVARQSAADLQGGYQPLFESIEGSANEDWPLSPPFQNVFVERRAGGEQVALLVGMAGSSYWSASVQLQISGKLTFDIACLVRATPRFLGSTYQSCSALSPQLRHEPDGTQIEFLPTQGQLVIRPTMLDQIPATLRWRYEL